MYSPKSLEYQIDKKNNYNQPYYASIDIIKPFLTDQDHFPYTRNFRGMYESAYPVINERQVGWRPLNNRCYKQINYSVTPKATFCWQYPCSTIFPCREEKHDNAAPPPPENVSCNKKKIILPP